MPQVPTPEQLEYFLLQYAPSLLTDEGVNVGVVLWTPASPSSGFCGTRFAPSWRVRVQSFDPDADIETLAAIFADIERRLQTPDLREQMLTIIQDSFSNMIRASESRKCVCEDPTVEIEAIAARCLMF